MLVRAPRSALAIPACLSEPLVCLPALRLLCYLPLRDRFTAMAPSPSPRGPFSHPETPVSATHPGAGPLRPAFSSARPHLGYRTLASRPALAETEALESSSAALRMALALALPGFCCRLTVAGGAARGHVRDTDVCGGRDRRDGDGVDEVKKEGKQRNGARTGRQIASWQSRQHTALG